MRAKIIQPKIPFEVKRVLLILGFSFLNCQSWAQGSQLTSISGYVKNSAGEYLFAAEIIPEHNKSNVIRTDSSGHFILQTQPGTITLTIQHWGYISQKKVITIGNQSIHLDITLEAESKELGEVYITASESRDLTASSTISKEAMKLLQPSSFTDVLELLPGGRARVPELTRMNQIQLRQAVPPSGARDDVSSLGTAFYVDGAPMITNGNLQSTNGFTATDPHISRDATNKGVDMRSISTDQIESVEIVRGIPSVEYGDLSSGLVLINRKKGNQPFSLRMKADGFSKLVAAGKGWYLPEKKISLNVDLDYLDAKGDPRNNYSTYERISLSLRSSKEWKLRNNLLRWNSALDYGRNLDVDKADPDNTVVGVDNYKSYYNRYNFKNQFSLLLSDRFFKSVDLTTSLNYQTDKIDLVRLIQPRTATVLVTTIEPGAYDVGYLTSAYAGKLLVDGKPLNGFAKIMANAAYKTGFISHKLKLGSDFSYSKNFGLGQVYDMNFPTQLSGSVQVGATTRPRAFKDIAAMQQLAAYVENKASFVAGTNYFTLATGARAFKMLGMGPDFFLSDKIAIDPRVNLKWRLPSIFINSNNLVIELGAGYGSLTKSPTLDHLYPPKEYVDLIQLNYYHNNSSFRTANVLTYVFDKTNYKLSNAVNKKRELSIDFSYDRNRLTVTYFKENMRSGFRQASLFNALEYKKYDNTSVNADTLSAKPATNDFAYTVTKEYYGYSITNNGSGTFKEGIEYQFTSKRFTSINTRFTVNGAWFRTTYTNSLPYQAIIDPSLVLDGKVRQYVGIYPSDEGTYYAQLNTNLTVDSYLPALGLNVAMSAQSLWYNVNQQAYTNGWPYEYTDIYGNVYPYTPESSKDADLQWLIRSPGATMGVKLKTPIDFQLNLKLSKGFRKDKAVVSLFVNRLLSYAPDYTNELGMLIARPIAYRTPYFGMELNFNL